MLPARAQADAVDLQNGRRLVGIITRDTVDKIEILTSGGKLSLPRARIRNIVRETDALNALRRAEFALHRGEAEKAQACLDEALRLGASPREARLWCVGHGSEIERALKPRDTGSLLKWSEIARRLGGLATTSTLRVVGENAPTSPTLVLFERYFRAEGGLTSRTLAAPFERAAGAVDAENGPQPPGPRTGPSAAGAPSPTTTTLSPGADSRTSGCPAPFLFSTPEGPKIGSRGRPSEAREPPVTAGKQTIAGARSCSARTVTATNEPYSQEFLGAGSRIPRLAEDERDFVLTMARILSGKGEKTTAAELVARLDAETLADAMRTMGFVQSLMILQVKDRLDAMDFGGALRLIDRMDVAGMAGGEACRILLFLRWSSFERRQGRYKPALDILSQCLAPLSPSLAHERMVAVLSEARAQLVLESRYEEAIGLYEKWGGLLAPETKDDSIALLYHDWGQHLLETDQPGRAREVFRRYYELKPQADRNLLDLCEYREKLLALGRKDYASTFELAQWAAERGLVSEAIAAYERACANPDLRGPAQEQIALLREKVVMAHMERCVKLFEDGDPRRALEELNKFPFLASAERLVPEIQNLRDLCYAELKRRSELRSVQAETLFQDAQRRFFMGESGNAARDLKQILETYGDTPVVERAAEFLRYVQTREDVRRLEGASAARPEASLHQRPNPALEKEIKNLIQRLNTE